MIETTYSRKWAFLVFLLSSFILYFYIKAGFFSLNNWLYHLNGDSLKNYFNVLQSVKHSEGFWLDYVNYPFGEQLFFLDSQPVLAKIISVLHLENYTIGIVNGLPLLSISLSTIPLFLIQRELKISLMINITTAIIIAFLAPQIARVPVHFALAYGVFIPMLLYFIFANFKSENFRYFLILVWLLLFSFLHPYYLLIGVVLLSSFMCYHLLIQFNVNALLLNLLVVILPLVIVKMVLFYSDPVLDRPEMPFGMLQYRSTFSSVFIPKFKPFIEIIPTLNFLPKRTFEGNSYVGILGFPVLLITIARIFNQLINNGSIKNLFRTEKFFYVFFASLTIWVFALYYPLKEIIDPLIEMIPILKQFRSLGRFGWIFYFVFSIFITLNLEQLYVWLKQKTTISFSFSILLILISLWFLDANGNLNTIKDALINKQTVSFKNSKYLSSDELGSLKIDSDFNTILTLPIFSVGSEIENYEGSGYSVYETYILSNVLNVPFVSTYSSRVSASQFYKVKKIKEGGELNDFFTENESLLIVADVNNLNSNELKILENAEVLFKKDFMVYAKYKVKKN